jgi:hypothetical protein
MRIATPLAGMLPKIGTSEVMVADGAICQQMVKCGKPNCKCVRGELHGPYFYRFTRDQCGRLHKRYVRRSEVAAWRELCERRREWFWERAAMRALCRRVVGRGGRVNWRLAAVVLSLPWKRRAVTPDGGLSRGLICAAYDFAVLTDVSIAMWREIEQETNAKNRA